MAGRRPVDPGPPVIKQFTAAEIDRAIPRLRRRIAEVQQLLKDRVRSSDARVEEVVGRIREDILAIFGPESPQYRTHRYLSIHHGTMYMGMPDHEFQAQFQEGIPQTVTTIEGLIRTLEERRVDLGADPGAPARAALEGADLHPEIASAAMPTFRNAHYREAVVNAAIALGDLVKAKSGRADLDGVPLMQQAFSRNGPILAFNDLADRADLDEQEGMMHLFEGAIMALRNPRAHALDPDNPDDARDILTFLSYLAKCLDRARKVK